MAYFSEYFNRNENKPGMAPWYSLSSTFLRACRYSLSSNTIDIHIATKTNNQTYTYPDISIKIADGLTSTTSPGAYYNKYIKGKTHRIGPFSGYYDAAKRTATAMVVNEREKERITDSSGWVPSSGAEWLGLGVDALITGVAYFVPMAWPVKLGTLIGLQIGDYLLERQGVRSPVGIDISLSVASAYNMAVMINPYMKSILFRVKTPISITDIDTVRQAATTAFSTPAGRINTSIDFMNKNVRAAYKGANINIDYGNKMINAMVNTQYGNLKYAEGRTLWTMAPKQISKTVQAAYSGFRRSIYKFAGYAANVPGFETELLKPGPSLSPRLVTTLRKEKIFLQRYPTEQIPSGYKGFVYGPHILGEGMVKKKSIFERHQLAVDLLETGVIFAAKKGLTITLHDKAGKKTQKSLSTPFQAPKRKKR